MSRPILYLTFDGVLQPLAFSQVVRVVTALARRGFPYHVLSVERTRDLNDRANVEGVRRVFSDAGVEWTSVRADLNYSVRRSGEAFTRSVSSAVSIIRRHDIKLIHARGYHAAAAADAVRLVSRVPFIFDARGCWIDERTDWFSSPAKYAAGKLVERRLYRDAQAVVTLTELHAQDVVNGAFGRRDGSTVVTIPTCADYDEFKIGPWRPGKPINAPIVPSEIQRRLHGHLVLGIVGALNRSYLAQPALSLIRHACAARADVHLLLLTQQPREYADLLRASDIAPDRYTLVTAPHADLPTWLGWIDWGLMFLADTISKRGSMPTKLAEFFASGVRPIAHGCNSEMTSWVRRAGSGIVLDELDERTLRDAAQRLIHSGGTIEELHHAREATRPHFSLASGVDRYAALLDRIS